MISAGVIAGLARSELAVYLVIAGHIDGRDWSARPAIDTIAELAGMDPRTAQRNLARLEAKGLIRVARGGGRNKTNTYTLTTDPGGLPGTSCEEKPRHPGDTLSPAKPRHLAATLSTEKPRQIGAETPAKYTLNPGTQVPPEQQNSRTAAAAHLLLLGWR
jgi:hypothetical protein